MAERDKELQLLEKRFAELADRAWQQNLFVLPAFYRWQSRKCSGEALQRQEYISNYTAEWMVQSGVWAGSEIRRNSDMKSRFRSVR